MRYYPWTPFIMTSEEAKALVKGEEVMFRCGNQWLKGTYSGLHHGAKPSLIITNEEGGDYFRAENQLLSVADFEQIQAANKKKKGTR